jgi:type IV pilus assembly protein PilW
MNASKQRGFSLVEVMIAMTIGLVISALVATIFASSSATYKAADSQSALQETGRVALENIDRDVQNAGFRGCNSNNVNNSGPLINLITAPTSFVNDLATPLQGYDAAGAGWAPALPAEIAGAVPAPTPGSDILVVRLPVGTPMSLSAPMATTSSDIPVFSAAGFAANDNAFIADCSQTDAFQISGMIGATLRHTVGVNTNAAFSRAFAEDAIVMRFETHAYYVAPSSRDPATETSLWMLVDGAAPVEVVEDVEGLQIQYGEDTDGDYLVNVYRKAGGVANFSAVVSLQVSLLLRGPRAAEAQAITDYVYNGATVTPADRYTRRVYTANIQLRNRTL